MTAAARKGEVLDAGPALLIPDDEVANTVIGWYVFDFDSCHLALCLGRASMLNHSAEPNVEVSFDDKGPSYQVTALRALQPGAELLIDYGPDYWG